MNDPSLFNIPNLYRIPAELDPADLRHALIQVIAKHPMLRARLDVSKGEPFLESIDTILLDFSVKQLPTNHVGQPDIAGFVSAPLAISDGAPVRFDLLRTEDGEQYLLAVTHHLIWDAASEAVFLRDLSACLKEGHSADDDNAFDFVEVAQAQRSTDEVDPGDRRRVGVESGGLMLRSPLLNEDPFACSFFSQRLGGSTYRALTQLARDERVTPFMALLCAFRLLLAKSAGLQSAEFIAAPIDLRRNEAEYRMIGCKTNVVVIQNALDWDETLRSALKRERSAVMRAIRRSEEPMLEHLVAMRDGSAKPPGASFSYTNLLDENAAIGDSCLQRVALEAGIAQFDLAVDVVADGNGLEFLWCGRALLYGEAELKRLADRFVLLLEGSLADTGIVLADISLQNEADRNALARAESTGDGEPVSVVERFLAWAAKQPDALAVECSETRLTYEELADAANYIAEGLRSIDLPPGSSIAMLMERSAYLPAAILGIFMAGHCVLPLDPSHPPSRLEVILRHAAALAIVSDEGELPLDPSGLPVISIGQGWEPSAASAQLSHSPNELAYVLYTSGSSGSPKGVAITHSAIGNCLEASSRLFDCRPGKRMLSSTMIAFDIATFEILFPLISGAALIVARKDMRDGSNLKREIETHRPDYFQGTPAVWKLLYAAGWKGQDDLCAMIGGDMVSPELASRLIEDCGEVWHTYGPTESTFFMLAQKLEEAQTRSLPLGFPLAGTRAYIVDRNFRRCLPGRTGELCISGAGIARFYLRMPRETAASFVPNPFAVEPGECLYRTGDLARQRIGGEFEILGRIDRQVKLRGFRIEPEEIEYSFRAIEGVAECVVFVADAATDRARIVACVESDNAHPVLDDELCERVRAHAARNLPYYMVPSVILASDALPLGNTGKINRTQVELDAMLQFGQEQGRSAPGSSMRADIVKIWADLLGIAQISEDSDFVMLGGNSISATLGASMIRDRFGIRFDAMNFLIRPRFSDFMNEVEREFARDRRIRAIQDADA